MSYSIKVSEGFKKKFHKLDFVTQRIISRWILKNLENTDNPRRQGKALAGNLKGLWRYRIGDYRLIVDIMDEELVIVAVDIGHRRDIYR